MKITIEINTGNAAFEGQEEIETGRILSELGYKLTNEGYSLLPQHELDSHPLRDINGNRVGSIKVTED